MKNLAKIIGSGLLLASVSTAQADIVHLDDVIIDGSVCVGLDCVNGESFGFDTIRMKENNLRIRAFDTSSSASFPTRDWQITFNDSSNGGLNKFSIDDIDGGRTPMTIEGNAPSHSLYVDDGGRLGLGTSTPVADVHVKSGNTPTLRLEQDGSSGFTPQTWDVAGNEANFFIRDATSGSTLPFRIYPGAPTSALIIEGSTGDIGVGTTAPDSDIHVVNSAAENTTIKVENTNASTQNTELTLKNDTREWKIRNNTNGVFVINEPGAGDPAGFELELDADGNLEIQGSLTTTGGTCGGGGCDLVFANPNDLDSIEVHAASMWTNRHLPAVGPTQENAPFNITQKTGGMLNELEMAHIYIEQLHLRLEALEMKLGTN